MVATPQNSIEQRLQAVEDELAIIRLIASYGPMVDTGLPDLAPQLFADDGFYDVSVGRLEGPDAVRAMLSSDEHQTVVRQGIAHVMGMPFVTIDGDKATAVNATQLFLRESDGYRIFRIAQNLWNLAREGGRWKIVGRYNRLIGDDDEARLLLVSAMTD